MERLSLWWRVVSLAWNIAGEAQAGREGCWSLGKGRFLGSVIIRGLSHWIGRERL